MTDTNTDNDKPRILIIDDERFNLNALSTLLKGEHKVMVATNGEQGLAAARTGRPDLILLDVNMPGIDGYEVCRQLKSDERTQSIPVIFITALGDAADETRGFEIGAVDYIVKPFNLAVVRVRVRTHLKLKLQSDLLERYAFRDGLTGIHNRRALEDKRAAEWTACERENVPLSTIILDVDFFKLYNDHYGHGAGDECLRRVARALSGCVTGARDLIARYGGEEFAVILPNRDLTSALELAERLRRAIELEALPHATSKVGPSVTISVGAATTVPGASASSLVLAEHADKMLYAAKQGGRNRVHGSELSRS